MAKKTIRAGMRVRSIYDPERIFTIDRSKKPARIYHEKGSRRWYGAFELQPVLSRPVKLSAKMKKAALAKRSDAFLGHPPGTFPSSPKVYKRTCANCGTEFESARVGAKFCKTRGSSCRAQYWKRLNEEPEVPKPKPRLRVEDDEMSEMSESLADA